MFVITDDAFPLLKSLSTSDDAETDKLSLPYVLFVCGVIRGVLAVATYDAQVDAEVKGEQCE